VTTGLAQHRRERHGRNDGVDDERRDRGVGIDTAKVERVLHDESTRHGDQPLDDRDARRPAVGSAERRPADWSRMSDETPIVFVVGDDPSVRASMERLLRSVGLDVETFESAAELIRAPRPERPACLVLDVGLPGQSGLDLQRELVAAGVTIPIVFVTGQGDIPMTVRAMKAGAVEFLTKPYRRNHLLDAVRTAIERDRVARRDRSEMDTLRARYAELTAREREVMTRIVAGMLNKQIAFELDTVESTVKFHRAHIMQKMHAKSLADLVGMATRLGLPRG
jgi:FixJ family two-component response regulator